jgi:1-acyl-sn-glycerol-3-phosphate acyltransferase
MWREFNYWWRLFAKTLSFALFGMGALLLSLLVFPALRICVHPRQQTRRAMRKTVSLAFSFFLMIMRFLGLVRLNVSAPEKLRNARGIIVVANHPSLIDIVILIAYMPQADCIIKSRLRKNLFIRGVVSIYIPNSLTIEDTTHVCANSLAEGNSLVIFPEGTRTASDNTPRLKRGSARLALRLGCGILPVHIHASDPRGLRKGDRFFSLSRDGPVRFTIRPQEEISIENYRGQEEAKSARRLTKEIQVRIVPGNHYAPGEHKETFRWTALN